MAGEETPRGSSAPPERQTPLPPLVASALGGGSGTLHSRLDRIRSYSSAPGRYTLLGDVGQGGMGQVLRVWDEVLDRELAVKVVALELDEGASEEERQQHGWKLERFIEEARVTGQLEHPGIVPVHDISISERGQVFFTMPLVQGDTLKRIFKLARNGLDGWTVHRALGVIHMVCQTVAFAHQSGVVHRDLKPENIMVGRFGEVYVMDWGLALILGKSDRESVVGTPAYMSPEQASGRLDQVGPLSDVYSIGALLYELFAGRMPHEASLEEGRGEGRSFDAILSRPPRALNLISTKAPPELVAIVDKAMAATPGERYGSMEELADDLSAWLEGRIVHAYDTRLRTRLRKWRARNRPLAWALDAIALLLVASITVFIALQRGQIREVRAAYEEVEANSYVANVAAAELGLRAHQAKAAKRWLEACAEGQRGWEWGHLDRRADASIAVLDDHGGAVRAVGVHPDGRFIATGSDDGDVGIWNAESHELVRTLSEHDDVVSALAFHPRTGLLATASRDETVRLWDVETGTCTRVIRDHGDDVISLAFGAGGAWLASGDAEGNVVVTWMDGSRESRTLRCGEKDIRALAPDPAGGRVVIAPHGTNELLFVSIETGEVEARLEVGDVMRALAVDPRGARYAVAVGRAIKLIDAAELEIETVLTGHLEGVGALGFDATGKSLASGGFDNVVHVWDVGTGELRLSFDGHDLDVNSVAFHPDGRRLVSGSEDDTARVWSRTEGPCLVIEGHDGWVNTVGFSSDGHHLYSGGYDHTLRRWSARTGRPEGVREVPEAVIAVAGTPSDGVAYGCEDGVLHLTDKRLLQDRRLTTGAGHPRTIVVAASGERILQRSSEGTITAHDLADGRLLFEWPDNGDTVYSLAIAPGGERYAMGTPEGVVEVRDTRTNERLASVDLDVREVRVLAYDPTDRFLAAGTGESTVHLLDARTLELLGVLGGHERLISALAFSPDGERLASGSFDETLRIWSTRGTLLLTLRGHTQPITALAFHPSGADIVSASKDGTLRLWRGR